MHEGWKQLLMVMAEWKLGGGMGPGSVKDFYNTNNQNRMHRLTHFVQEGATGLIIQLCTTVPERYEYQLSDALGAARISNIEA